jgi:hypothetical protein
VRRVFFIVVGCSLLLVGCSLLLCFVFVSCLNGLLLCVMCVVCFVLLLYYCHRVKTHLQLKINNNSNSGYITDVKVKR